MRDMIIYTVTSLLIIVVVLLAISGQIVPSLFAVALGFVMRKVYTTERGRKWWRTWYRVGMEFDLMLRGQVSNNKQNKKQ